MPCIWDAGGRRVVPVPPGALAWARFAGACVAGAVPRRHAPCGAASPSEEMKAWSVPCALCNTASSPPLKQPRQVNDSRGNC